jgi:patatin-like phospholipase/acyl hydrolase
MEQGAAAENPPSPLMPAQEPVKLLCLDGGGVKGISSLLILHEIMERVKSIESETAPKDASDRLPVNYFNLAGGTSTGGLIALMLFRLNMSTADAIENYDNMARRVFSPTLGPLNLHWLGRVGYWLGNGILTLKGIFLPAKFSAKPLESVIDEVVKKSKVPDANEGGEALLLSPKAGKL